MIYLLEDLEEFYKKSQETINSILIENIDFFFEILPIIKEYDSIFFKFFNEEIINNIYLYDKNFYFFIEDRYKNKKLFFLGDICQINNEKISFYLSFMENSIKEESFSKEIPFYLQNLIWRKFLLNKIIEIKNKSNFKKLVTYFLPLYFYNKNNINSCFRLYKILNDIINNYE